MRLSISRSMTCAAILFVLGSTILLTGNVLAQTTKVELYADANRTSCELVDQGTAARAIYVFHTGVAQATGLRFKAPKPDCWLGATWIGDQSEYLTVENSQSDWSVLYGECKTLPVLVGQINYFATGGSEPCCESVAQDPGPVQGQPTFGWVDCIFIVHPLIAGQKVVINGNESCRCTDPLATESSTWGGVKSLYR